jgi:hypothetical protein
MNVLLLNASPHGETSHGYRLAKEAYAMSARHPNKLKA